MPNTADATIALALLADAAAEVALAEEKRSAAEKHLFSTLRELQRAGLIDNIGLYEAYHKYRRSAPPGYGRRWSAAGLPTRQKLTWALRKSVTAEDDTYG